MKIGTLVLRIYGEFPKKDYPQYFIGTMLRYFRKMSDVEPFCKHSRFAFFASAITFEIQLNTVFTISVYKYLKSQLDFHFTEWNFILSLTMHLKGDDFHA